MTVPPANRLVVFDCDGTLVDSQHMILASMNAAFDRCGLARADAQAVRRVVGLSLPDAVAVLLPEADMATVIEVAELYKAQFRDLRQQHVPEPLYPGIPELLAALDAQGFLLGVATGKSRRGLLAALERHGLGGYFVTLQTADDAPGKPHPAMLRQAMAEAGAAPATTIMVGDTTFDMAMAKAAGTHALGVAWGYHEPEELLVSGARHVAGSSSEIIPLSQGLFGLATQIAGH